MLKTTKITILCLSLSLLAIFSQLGLIAKESRWQPYWNGDAQNEYVTTTLVNRTRYKLWLQTGAVSMSRGGVGLYDYKPFGAIWIEAGKTQSDKSKNYAPDGNAYIYYTMDENTGIATQAPWHKVDLNGKNATYNFPEFTVEVKAVPIKIYYAQIPGNLRANAWTYLYYDYIITIDSAGYNK